MEEHIQEEVPEQVSQMDTRHEPHEHAPRRLIIAGIAILSFVLIGAYVWAQWGEAIQDACFGDGEVCTVELPDTL